MNAIEINKLSKENFNDSEYGKSLCFTNLPTVSLSIEPENSADTAILSWRWDLSSNCSRNVYIACQEAKKQGIRYLLIDKISINQSLSDQQMLTERLEFSKLYQKLPVLAAYDCPASQPKPTAIVHGTTLTLGNEFAWIIRRPWIFYEVQLYRNNPCPITYIGYIKNLGCSNNFGFDSLVDSIWTSPMSAIAKTIIYTLQGTVNMNYIEEFRYIFPQHYDILSKAYVKLSRNDYLLFVGILSGGGDRINDDQNILDIKFDQFSIGEGYTPDDLPKTQDYYTRYDIHFRETVIGYWQTRHKFYPFEQLKVWFVVNKNAADVIFDYLGFQKSEDKEYDNLVSSSTEDKRPVLNVVLHESDLL